MKILVVDDDPVIGRVVSRVLSGHHEVVVATSAREALALIDSAAHYDAIVLDLLMPEMNGVAFHRALAERHPDLARRSVLLSGGASDSESLRFVTESGLPQVEKPFEARVLLAAIVEALGR